MKKVAKVILIDKDEQYLLLFRSNHPVFGNDPDLPGGTREEGESTVDTVIREAEEETGIVVKDVEQLYAGLEYSIHGTHKSLFMARVERRPDVKLSWEHQSFEWLPRDEFLQKAKDANDSYMHMVYEVLSKQVVEKHSAGGVVIENGKVLTISWTTHDYVSFPKGGLNEGESSEEAAVREVFEETGYRTRVIRPLKSSMYEFTKKGIRCRKLEDYYLMERIDDSDPTPHREPGEDFENHWLTIEEAMEALSFEDTREVLRSAIKPH